MRFEHSYDWECPNCGHEMHHGCMSDRPQVKTPVPGGLAMEAGNFASDLVTASRQAAADADADEITPEHVERAAEVVHMSKAAEILEQRIAASQARLKPGWRWFFRTFGETETEIAVRALRRASGT